MCQVQSICTDDGWQESASRVSPMLLSQLRWISPDSAGTAAVVDES